MPRVKIDYIVSFSSEDPDNPASNLISWEVSKKRWLCAKGEPSCSIVLQLTKAVKISGIHIGAHNAAFVEVLVGRSEKPNEPFQVLLPSSVFLSPSESRRAESVERVRSFSEPLLSGGAQRWDRVRLVCSQPYNKHCKYGLSFVQIYEPESLEIAMVPSPGGSSDDEFKPGELFAAHRTTSQLSNSDTGSQIRQATSQALKNISDSATKLVKTPITKKNRIEPTGTDYDTNRKRDGLMYTPDDDKPHAKIDHVVKRHKDDKTKQETSTSQKVKNDYRKKNTSDQKDDASDTNSSFSEKQNKKSYDDIARTQDNDVSENKYNINKEIKKESKSDEASSSRKNKHSQKTVESRDDFYSKEVKKRSETRSEDRNETPNRVNNDPSTSKDDNVRPKKRSRTKPEKQLGLVLHGVVLTFSGYVNPERTELRQLATSMGAAVTRDWEPICTHLVCAFPNTPKLKQVRSERGDRVPVVLAQWIRDAAKYKRKPAWRKYATEPRLRTQDDTDTDTDTDTDYNAPEECDTDDEIEKVLRAQKKPRVDTSSHRHTRDNTPPPTHADNDTPPPNHAGDNSDGDDTDRDTESECVERIDPDRCLPAMFEARTFLLRGDQLQQALWARYIRAYSGLVLQEEELDEDSVVDFVISEKGDDSVDGVNHAAYRTPSWLWTCHRLRRVVTPH